MDGWSPEPELDFPATLVPLLGWHLAAACADADPDAFFPEQGGSSREARAICAGCAVRAECLDYAIDNKEQFGIWGGTSELERRALRRERSREKSVLAS